MSKFIYLDDERIFSGVIVRNETTTSNHSSEQMPQTVSDASFRLGQILKGEISAVEAYEHILNRFALEPDIGRLEEIKMHHESAVHFWAQLLAGQGVKPTSTSGPWGHIVKTFVDTAQFFGDTASLRALEAGETYGLTEYHDLMMDSSIPPGLKDKIKETFIPQQEQHIALLEAWKGN